MKHRSRVFCWGRWWSTVGPDTRRYNAAGKLIGGHHGYGSRKQKHARAIGKRQARRRRRYAGLDHESRALVHQGWW